MQMIVLLNLSCKTFSVGDAESVSVDTCGKLDELEKIYRGGASAAADREHSDEETGGGEEVEEAAKRRGTPSAAGNVFSLTGKSQFVNRFGGGGVKAERERRKGCIERGGRETVRGGDWSLIAFSHKEGERETVRGGDWSLMAFSHKERGREGGRK